MTAKAHIIACVAITTALAACATQPGCETPRQKLSAYLEGTKGDGWFDEAIVQTSYHVASIAPAEILTDTSGNYFADRLTMAEQTCNGEEELQALLGRSHFVKIAGHGHYLSKPRRVFVIDCLCKADPIADTPELRKKMEPMFPP